MAKNHGLTAKQQHFAVEYSKGLSATQAAIRAGYAGRSAAVAGSRLSRSPKVMEQVFRELQQHGERFQASSDRVLEGVYGTAFANLHDYVRVLEDGSLFHDIPKLKAAAGILTFRRTERGVGEDKRENITIGFPKKLHALNLLWRHVGLSSERQSPASLSGIEKFSDAALCEFLRAADE